MTEYGVDFSISHFWSTHLVGGCSFDMSNITCFSYFFKKKIFSITIPCSWNCNGNIHLAHFNHIQETLYLSAFQAFLLIKALHRRELKPQYPPAITSLQKPLFAAFFIHASHANICISLYMRQNLVSDWCQMVSADKRIHLISFYKAFLFFSR